MPRPKSDEDLEVINIRLFKGDYEELGRMFPKLKAGPAVRKIIRNFIERQKASVKTLDIDLSVEVLDEVLEN